MITVVKLTLTEAVRRRLVWALVGLTIASVALTAWGFERLVVLGREHGATVLQLSLGVSQVLILVAFMFSFVLAMTAAFMAAPAVGDEIDSGVALAILARPLRRSRYLLGKWLGLSILVTAYAVGGGFLEVIVVRVVTGYQPPQPMASVGYLAFEANVLLTLALVIGTRLPGIASGAIVVVVYGLTWIAGVMGGVGTLFKAPALVTAADASRVVVPIDGLWRGVVYGLEPGVMRLLGDTNAAQLTANPFFARQPPTLGYVAWSVAWIAAALVVGVIVLRRREI